MNFRDYKVYVSTDGEAWGDPLVRGTLEKNTDLQRVDFPKNTPVRALQFRIIDGQEKLQVSGMAEIDFLISEPVN